MYEGLSTFIIDGSDNAKRIVEANDIYGQTEGQIDVLKLASKITTVRITGNIQRLITAMDKQEVTAALEVTSPEDPSINFHCDYALLKNAGQSTLGMPVPSMHVKLDKNNNICYDRDNKVLPKNRWAFRKGNVPEKKFRLQSNYMDSSGCHNGSFLRMFNSIVNSVEIGGRKVLRIPAQAYAQDEYPEAMKELHGADKDASRNWKFPYNINMVPDSIACVVIWRPNESSPYRFLGQYVIMEEKKSNYANGMHSIYDTVDANGNPDPFKFYTKDKNSERLWDNEDCLQVEIVERSDNTMLLDSSLDAIRNTTNFELIYPDPDDIKEEHEKDSSKPTVNDFWQKFFDGFVDPIRLKDYEPATTKEEHDQMVQDAQEEFDAIYASYRTDYAHCPIEKWHFVAYYCLMLRHCCVDSALRNIELTTYDGQHWLPKWWDVDMQCGLRQTGEGDVPPCSDRDSTIDNDSTFVFDGRYFNTEDGNRIYKSFYLWDALENCEEFMEDVREMDDALSKSWQYDSITQLQDDEYVGKWSESLYNESGMVKYVEQSYDSEQGVYSNDYLIMMQGSHVSHRHWFLKKSFDFFDSLHACGEYTNKKIYAKVQGASGGSQFKITASEPAYFCWGQTNTPAVTSVFLQKGQSYTFAIPDNYNIGSSPLDIYAANRLEEVDFMDLAHYLQGTVSFEFCYDAVTGSGLKRVLAGISMTDMLQGEFNNYGLGDSNGNLTMIGLSLLDKLEVLDVRGLLSLNSIEIAGCVSLKEFYAAGSNITTFEPAAGTIFEEVELPTTVSYIHLNGSKLPTSGIDWYETASDNGDYTLTEADMPRVTRLELQNCGNDAGVRALVEEWCQTIESYIQSNPEQAANFLNNIAHISIDDVNWANFSVTHLITLSKIVNKQITGYIMCSTAYTNEQMDMLMANFGDSVFTLGSPLVLDCVGGEDSGKITAAPLTQNDAGKVENYDDRIEIRQGHSAKLRYIGFPLARTQVTYTWYVNNSNSWFGSGHNKHRIIGDVITLDEASALDEEYEITCSISGDDVSQNVTQDLVAKSRSYPSSVELKPKDSPNVLYIQSADEYQISNDSVNTFEAQFTPDSYDGTLDEGHWELTPNPNSETESIPEGITHHNGIRNTGGGYSDEDRFFTLDITGISELQEDISLMLSYYSDWKASNKRVPSSGTANAIINILKNIVGVLTSSGNYHLYNIIYAISPHPNASPSYGSAFLKSITGEIKASEYPDAVSLVTSVICGNYNVLQYMPNVSVFDFHDCIKLKGNIDLSLNSRCTKAIFANTDTGDIELYEGGREVSVIGYAHPSKLELSGFYLTTSQKPVSWAGHVKQTRIPFLSGSGSMKNGFPCGEAVNCANPSARNGIKVDNTARAISIDDVVGIDTISLAYQGNLANRYWCLAFLAAIGGSLRTIRRPHFKRIITDKCYYGICYYEEGEYQEDWEPGGYTTIPESAKDSDGHFICMSRLELRASYSNQSAQDEGVAYRVLSREESASLLSRLKNSEDAEEQELADRLSAQMAFDGIESAIDNLTINNTETHFIGSDGNGSFVSKIAMSNYGGSIIWNPEFDKDNSTDDGSNYACGIVECRPKYNLEEEPYYIGVCRLKDFNKS